MAHHAGDYVYIVKERESIRLAESVFKVGYTTGFCARMKAYPKGSIVIVTLRVKNGRVAERAVLDAMRARHTQRRDLGFEYFQGSCTDIAWTFHITASRFACCDVASRALLAITPNATNATNAAATHDAPAPHDPTATHDATNPAATNAAATATNAATATYAAATTEAVAADSSAGQRRKRRRLD